MRKRCDLRPYPPITNSHGKEEKHNGTEGGFVHQVKPETEEGYTEASGFQGLLQMLTLQSMASNEGLLIINAALLGIVAFFLKLAVDVAKRALDSIQQMLVTQAEQSEILKAHANAIERHERALEKILTA